MKRFTILMGVLLLCFFTDLSAQTLFVPGGGIGFSTVPGNVGIATSSPLATFDVRGTNIFLSPPGTPSLPGSPIPRTFNALGESGGGAPLPCDLYGFRSQVGVSLSSTTTQVDFVNLGVRREVGKGGTGRATLSFGSEQIVSPTGPISLFGPNATFDIIAKNRPSDPGCGYLIAQFNRPGNLGSIFPTPSSAIPSFTVYGKIVTSNNYFISSDVRYKQNIADLDRSDEILDGLRPVTYNHREEEFPEMGFDGRLIYGFIAQEMEEIVPDLVDQDEKGFRNVNYVGLIPILTASLKNQKAIIEAQQEQIDQLREELEAAGVLDQAKTSPSNDGKTRLPASFGDAKLYQNSPNPFNAQTEIRYELPQNSETAQMIVFDMQGKQVRNYNLDGNGKLIINSGELEAGMYLYSLIINGQEVSTKRMILTQ
ncbi:MAG: tail fiber domain-containing protein [Bacteroidia bacterium]|nr:tail fiber domain-containing protein [Bacteroidia bacterium]